MMKRQLFLIMLLISSYLPAQTVIQSFPQPLRKELIKLFGEHAVLKDLVLPSSNEVSLQTGRYFSFSDHTGSFSQKYLYTGRVNTCRAGGCNGSEESIREKTSEYFDYFILFDASGSVILIKIYTYAATHGQEITSKAWLRQFKDYQGQVKLTIGKNIDAISGATVSVEAITKDIELRTRCLVNHLLARKTAKVS